MIQLKTNNEVFDIFTFNVTLNLIFSYQINFWVSLVSANEPIWVAKIPFNEKMTIKKPKKKEKIKRKKKKEKKKKNKE